LTNAEQGLDPAGNPMKDIADPKSPNLKSAAAPFPVSCNPVPDPASACATAGDNSPAISPNSAADSKSGFPARPTGQGALLAGPTAIVFDNVSGNVFFADTGNHRIRFFKPVPGFGAPTTTNPAIVFTLAGNGTPGSSGLGGSSGASLVNFPFGLALDSN